MEKRWIFVLWVVGIFLIASVVWMFIGGTDVMNAPRGVNVNLKASQCGNGVCEGFESHKNCRSDCYCGNGVCERNENVNNCPADCSSSGPAVNKLWTDSSGGNSWTPRVSTIGEQGTKAFYAIGPHYDYARKINIVNSDPPTYDWEYLNSEWTYKHHVASAENANVYVTLTNNQFNPGAGQFTLRKFSTSSTPDWEYVFSSISSSGDTAALHVSDDGQVIVAAIFKTIGSRVTVAVFNPGSNQSRNLWEDIDSFITSSFTQSDLSEDGSTLLLRQSTRIGILNVSSTSSIPSITNAFIFGASVWNGVAISGDGGFFAVGTQGGIIVRQRGPNGYTPLFTHPISEDYRTHQIDISADSSTIVAAMDYTPNQLTHRVIAIDVASQTETMSWETTGTGSYQNSVSDLSVSEDGETFVVASWGDEDGNSPDLVFFDKNSDVPLSEFVFPGSALSAEISGDGLHAVATTKAGHANGGSSVGGGAVHAFEIS